MSTTAVNASDCCAYMLPIAVIDLGGPWAGLGGPAPGKPRHGARHGHAQLRSENEIGTPRHAQARCAHTIRPSGRAWAGLCQAHVFKTAGTGTPNHMTGVPGRACAWAGQAHGTDEARPGQSLSLPTNCKVECLIDSEY